MNSIENSICDAIEMIVERSISQANFDKTIQATVIKCIDKTIGKYSVRYQDSTFYAYSDNSDMTYTEGSTVYVLIPGNNTEADKTIIGTTKKLGINYVSTVEGDEAYQIIGNNCIADSSSSFNLQSYKKNKQVKVLYSKQYQANQNLINLNKTAVNEYVKNQQTIICGAMIRTALPAEQQFRGNYGLIFALNFTDNTNNSVVTRYYTVDVDKMSGNPYKLLYDTRQYGIFDIDGKNFIDVENISIFCYDFPNSKEDSLCVDDIFIKNIELYGAERLKDNDLSSCSLTFYTPQGIYFDDSSKDSDTRSIETQVRVKGKVVDNGSQKLPFYWFVEHAGITSESVYYNQYGGRGWKCLNDYTVIKPENEGDPPVVEWIPSSYKKIITKKDIVAKEVKYKCAVVYEGTVITKTIVIKNLSSPYDITISSDLGTKFYFDAGYPTLTCLINGQEKKEYTYSWAVTNNVGNFETVASTPETNAAYTQAYNNYHTLLKNIQDEVVPSAPNEVTLDQYKRELLKYDKIMRVDGNTIWHLNVNTITNFSTYQCTVYNGDVYLGTASIVLTNSLVEENGYTMVINDGSRVFKYNESGVGPASKALDSPIEIKALTFSVYDSLGNVIDDEIIRHSDIRWIVPTKNTMLKIPNYYEEKGEDDEKKENKIYKDFMSFAYEIQDRYDITKTNNNIQVIINYQGRTLSAKTDLVFTKEGDEGTNGTEYFCRIVPNVASGSLAPQYPTLTIASDSSWSLNYHPQTANVFFRVQLWHNENKVLDSATDTTSDEGVSATIKWSILKNKYNSTLSDGSHLTVDEKTGVFSFNPKYQDDHPADIIKVELNYDKGVDGKNLTYYATMPLIAVHSGVRKTGDKYDRYSVKLKEGTGFLYAIYSSDGKNPRYNKHPFELQLIENLNNGYYEDITFKNKSSDYKNITYEWSYLGGVYTRDSKGQWNFTKHTYLADVRSEETLHPSQKYVKPADDYDGQCVNNAVKCEIKRGGQVLCSIHIPVHLMLNRYGNSAINGWDGNSVNIDKEGGFILAPQMGAGIKESDNSFTGVVMGKVQEANQTKADVGLVGYAHGQRSFFLDSNTGKSVFGTNGQGQIIIDPTNETAKISSKNYDRAKKTGMLIDFTTPQILFGSGNFEVNKEGHITAKGGGTIAGWTITDTELYSPASYASRRLTLDSGDPGTKEKPLIPHPKIYSNSRNTLDSGGTGFYLGEDGFSVHSATGGIVLNTTGDPIIYSGRRSSLTSYGSGFYLGGDGLSIKSATGGIVLSTAGDPIIYSGRRSSLTSYGSGFYLGGDGLSIKSATGGIVLSTAGDPTIYSNRHSTLASTSTGFYLGNDGLSLGSNFSVNASGALVAKSATITGSISANHFTCDENHIHIGVGIDEPNKRGLLNIVSDNANWSPCIRLYNKALTLNPQARVGKTLIFPNDLHLYKDDYTECKLTCEESACEDDKGTTDGLVCSKWISIGKNSFRGGKNNEYILIDFKYDDAKEKEASVIFGSPRLTTYLKGEIILKEGDIKIYPAQTLTVNASYINITGNITLQGNINTAYGSAFKMYHAAANNNQFLYGPAPSDTSDATNHLCCFRGNNVRIYARAADPAHNITAGAVYLGKSGQVAVTSDENFKDLYDIDNRYEQFFNNLNPKLYTYHSGHRKHIGFGARAVEKALLDAGLNTEDFAGILIDKDCMFGPDEMPGLDLSKINEVYYLRYEEFIALNTMMLKKALARIETLENKIKKMEGN